MLKKHHLFVFLLFLVFASGYGQNNLVYQNTENTVITVSYISEPDENQTITNYFIYEIARSIPKKTDFTQFIFNCKPIDRITETDPGKFSASFEITEVNCTGDILYKSFSIADVLIPTYCSFTFRVFADKAIPLYQTTVTDGKLNMGYNKLTAFTFSDTSKAKKFNTRVENLVFHYDESARQRFSEKLKLIDYYYLSETTINQCFAQIKTIDFNNIDMIIVYDIRLKDLEKTVNELYKTDFPGKLQLVTNDPIQFIDRNNKLSDTIFFIRQQLNQKLENLDKLYYEKGLTEIQNKETAKAEIYFKRSILYNPDFVPSQLELAKILLYRDSLLQAADKIAFILRTLKPSPEIYKNVIFYTDTIYNKMLAVGNEYVRVEKYNDAIEIFEKCVDFCQNLPGYSCTDNHVKSLALARFGIFQSYLSVSQKAIDNGKLELAEVYIADARKYQKIYNNFIINDAEALVKLEKLMIVYVAKGDTLNSKMNYEKGLFYLEKAQNISEKNMLTLPEKFEKSISKAHNGIYNNMLKKCYQQISSGFTETAEKTLLEAIDYHHQYSSIVTFSSGVDSLLTKIKSIQYNELINSGIFSLSINDYHTSLKHFDLAKKLELNYFFKKNLKLDSLIQTSALPLILNNIKTSSELLSLGNIDSAMVSSDEINKSILLHGLINDTSLIRQVEKLKNNIFDTRCKLAKEKHESFEKQADKAVAQMDYITSDTLFSQAINVSEDFPECNIDPDQAINGKKTYLLACNYQKMLEKANHLFLQNDFHSFFYMYYEVENFFQSMQLKNYGLIHQLLIDKVSISSDTAFVKNAVDFMIQKNRPEDALLCVKNLQKLNYSKEQTKNMQQQIGVIMACKDHAVNAGINPSILVVSFTANNKWLSYFKTSYSKTWKSLK